MRRTNLLRYLSRTVFSVAVAALAASSCSFITDSDIAAGGIGSACSSESDCQGASCDQGACVATCSTDGDCPETTDCYGGRCVVPDIVGEACQSNTDCKGAACVDGICATSCTEGTGTVECPGELECLSGVCQTRLKVAGVWVGVVGTGEGWTLTHHEGMLEAQEELGYIDFEYKEELIGPDVNTYVDEAIANGAEVIVANSFDHAPNIAAKAAEYPETTFLVCSGKAKEPNLGAYFGHLEQAWFVAGELAARKTKTKRLGFIGSYITPEVVRHLNAFTLGARSKDSSIVVEVRWMGFWYDPGFADPIFEYTPLHMGDQAEKLELTAEQYLTAKLIDSGVDVIGHQCDNQYPSRYVAQHTEDGTMVDAEGNPKQVWTIANDNRFGWRDAAGDPYTNAFGAVYWNWGPMYVRLFKQIHQKTWEPSNVMDPLLRDDPENSIIGFELSTGEKQIDDSTVQKLLNEAADRGPESVFTGPIKTTGQRPGGDLGSGEYIADGEYDSMCWFTEGVVERSNPNDPTSEDVPAKVPDDTHVGKMGDAKQPAQGTARQPTQAPEVLVSFADPPSLMWNCKNNQIIEE